MGIDLIGSGDKIVAVVEIDPKSGKTTGEIAEEIVKHNKNVKTVLEKSPGTCGKFRMRKQKIIWGDKNTEVVHKEHGYVLKLDPRKVYFSPREATIRQYISKQAKSGEKILVMFAGVGPYAISIAKTQPKVGEVAAVEINPDAIAYMRENIRINKVSHLVTPIEGDVGDVCEKSGRVFDRIIMPMKGSEGFLGLAAKCAKKSAIIQAYMISSEKNLFVDCEKIIKEVFEKIKTRYEIEDRRKISLYAPGKWKVLMGIKLK